MNGAPAPNTARRHFLLLHLTRLIGIGLVVCGLMIVEGQIAAPALAGWALLIAGLADVLIVPQLLARKWRSPRS